jgi:cobyrinic acid a,c-diamide synthase
MLAESLSPTAIRFLGALPRDEALAIPDRHLGLVQAGEIADLDARLDRAADAIGPTLRLQEIAPVSFAAQGAAEPPPALLSGTRIAIASDAACSFIYAANVALLESMGARVSYFSPLADESLPPADAIYLPGGYPELHAGALAAARNFADGLRRFAEDRPVHGECGGYMVLGTALTDADGVRHAMAGLLGLQTSFAQRRMHLGYRLAELASPIPGQQTGARLRGHEFHYSSILAQPDPPLAVVRDANGAAVAETGSRRGNVTGTFFHLIAEDR